MRALAAWLVVVAIGCAPPRAPRAPTLQRHLAELAERAQRIYGPRGLAPDGLALAAIWLRSDGTVERADVRGDAAFYPASLVKLFYLVALDAFVDAGTIVDSPELRRAATDMIVVSSNDAADYLLEVLTGAGSGGELAGAELAAWMAQRQAVNRYFHEHGYPEINACQKVWADGPYGRERQGYGPSFELRNRATANALARLWLEQLVAPRGPRAEARRALLARDFTVASADPDDQRTGFTGKAAPPGARLWSKAGWTSEVRHDSAYLELPGGDRVIWVILTRGVARETELIPTLSKWFLDWFVDR